MDDGKLAAVVARACRRDPAALAALVDAYSERVFGLLYRSTHSRELAEDLMQETFLRVVRTIDQYRHDGRFEAWLFRIAANLARDHARQRKRRGNPTALDDAPEDELSAARGPVDGAGPAQAALATEQRQQLAEELEQLSAEDREILLLRHYSGLSFREIAELLQIPLGTALARAHRALGKLRARLNSEGTALR